MRASVRSALAVLILSQVGVLPASAAERFDIAITVDDLPFNGVLPPGMSRLGIAQSYIATLKAHRVREAWGFVNAGKMDKEPGLDAVLKAWRDAGYPLGNHGLTHLNLARAPSLEAWQSDVSTGEPVVARYMRGADWRYYRFPNLVHGDRERHGPAAAYLHQRGYRTAHVSVAFDDWSYNDAYFRCVQKGDTAAIAAMKARYLQGVDQGITRMKAVSKRVFGRIIPQVLLTHLNAWAAMNLPAVMTRLDAAGARYTTLARAQADPAYAEAEKIVGGGSMLERTARHRRVDLSDLRAPRSALPPLNLSTICG